MARSKKFSKLLKKINGTIGSVFDTSGSFIGAGEISYKTEKCGNVLSLFDKQIPISSVRNITPNFNNIGPLIFVDAKYDLARRLNYDGFRKYN
jgi:hypothetical protein